jgi:hypothetical protein
MDDDELVSRRKVPELIESWSDRKISAKTLAKWQVRRIGPPDYRLPISAPPSTGRAS